jgi:hypothetical protein
MTYDDISIDIETLGRRWDAPVISIGAVPFNWKTGAMAKVPYYAEVDIDSAIRAGKVNGSTLQWWMQQGEKARQIFDKDNQNKVSLATALDGLAVYMRQYPGARPWGNGATFDITILEYAYAHGGVGLRQPWHFYEIRDMRTIVEAADFDKTSWPFPRDGVAHNALSDAQYQASVIAACRQKIARALGLLPPAKAAKTPAQSPAPAEDEEL